MKSLINLFFLSILLLTIISCGSKEIEPKRQYQYKDDNGGSSSGGGSSTKYYVKTETTQWGSRVTQFILKENGEMFSYTWKNESNDNRYHFYGSCLEGSWSIGSNGAINYTVVLSDDFSVSMNVQENNDCYNYTPSYFYGEQSGTFYTREYTEKSSFSEISYGPFCIINFDDFYLHRK
ncbi:hypothetical protein [Flammeovirga aprica]|uniref:Lipoprotein n=1 Tax=Flammeovirga aprica JL-4 TaxID=694437 RepID=A0A7X9S020_9BACT|nr:hypothetical protein [Flammeovirga aprica]NME71881.1 hypothetical protein [Flammeovirga aprica JL-4]